MKQFSINIIILIFLLFGAITSKIQAQITVGSGYAPEKAALLDIKTQEADATNITSTKGGLGLPRVKLVSLQTLEPFIDTTDPDWVNDATTKIKQKHTGLVVYNLETENNFTQDVYVWDGVMWKPIGGFPQRYFYVPSFNIPLPTAGGKVVDFDLYTQYESQLNGKNGSFVSSNSSLKSVPVKSDGSIYKRDELDYVITYYDKTVIKDTSISISSDGNLSFEVLSQYTTPASFLNIVFVIK